MSDAEKYHLGSKHLEDSPEYYFDRDEFVDIVTDALDTVDESLRYNRPNIDAVHLIEAAACLRYGTTLIDGENWDTTFKLWQYDETFYFLHLESGTLITYYKHLGQCNTCNKDGFNLHDLRCFFIALGNAFFSEYR